MALKGFIMNMKILLKMFNHENQILLEVQNGCPYA